MLVSLKVGPIGDSNKILKSMGLDAPLTLYLTLLTPYYKAYQQEARSKFPPAITQSVCISLHYPALAANIRLFS